jgi:arylsulfatase A-like enzyme
VAANLDVLPTFVRLAGGAVPKDHRIDGKDVWPLLSGKSKDSPHEAFSYYQGNRLRAVRSGPWKLQLEGNKLYNLDKDVGEATDVAAEHADVVKKLRGYAEGMRGDLGVDKPGPGCRPAGRVAKPVPLLLKGKAAEAPKKLNVLFILVDDLRPELGCYGHEHVKTPNIDALARACVRFDRAYCQYPLCNPSRTSMLTGRYPTTTGVLDNRTWFGAEHPDFVSLPKYFKANGYPTLRAGKVFHGTIDDADAWTAGGQKRNFEGAVRPGGPGADYAKRSDRWVVLEGDGEAHQDFKTAESTIASLRANKDRPFFIACGFTKPHSPPSAPQKYFDMYDPAKVPLPPDFASKPTVPEGFPARCLTPNGDLFIRREATPQAAREMIRAYWASLTWVDWNVGRVLKELDRLGLRERTVVVLWGDHGYHLGEKGKWSKHGSLFEVGTRVPLLIAAPGAGGNGKACPRVVQSLDIYPTLAELCGLPRPKGLEGRSLVPLLADPSAKWDRPAFSVFGPTGKRLGVAVRTERFRYVEYDGGKDGAMLFDEQADPHERKNLAADPKFAKAKAGLAGLARKFWGAERKGRE